MKGNKGFFLVYELLCLGFGCVLLAAAAQGFADVGDVQPVTGRVVAYEGQ